MLFNNEIHWNDFKINDKLFFEKNTQFNDSFQSLLKNKILMISNFQSFIEGKIKLILNDE